MQVVAYFGQVVGRYLPCTGHPVPASIKRNAVEPGHTMLLADE